MSERRFQPTSGRREADQWLGRAVRVIAVIGAIVVTFGAFSQGLNAVTLTKTNRDHLAAQEIRITRLETSSGALAYMACVNFAETHRAALVPAFCITATK